MTVAHQADIFQHYHRGFLGRHVKVVAEQDPRAQLLKRLRNLQYNSNVFTVDDHDPIFNDEIETLYVQYVKNAVKGNSFEFHEQVLKAAARAFGTYSFLEWIEVQRSSSTANHLQSQFLLDTVRFIQTGKRNLMIETWEPILNNPHANDEWEDVLSAALQLTKYIGSGHLHEVLRAWCMQPSGIADLLKTLHVLFGR